MTSGKKIFDIGIAEIQSARLIGRQQWKFNSRASAATAFNSRNNASGKSIVVRVDGE